MEAVARSYLMAGVALVGAGAIAAGPIQPVPPDIHVPAVSTTAAPVELSALVNPIELWVNVFEEAATNAGALADAFGADPVPILSSIVRNQLINSQVAITSTQGFFDGLASALEQLPQQLSDGIQYGILEGNIYDGIMQIQGALLSPVLLGAFGALNNIDDTNAALQNPFLNAASVINTALFQGIVPVGLPVMTELLAPVAQIAMTAQKVYDGLKAKDLEAVANALISFPSDLVGTLVNGNTDLGVPGLIGPNSIATSLLNFRKSIADSIHPPAVSFLPAPPADEEGLAARSFVLTHEETPPAAIDPADGEDKQSKPAEIQAKFVAPQENDSVEKVVENEDPGPVVTGLATGEDEDTGGVTLTEGTVTPGKPALTQGGKATPGTRANAHRPGKRIAAAVKSLGDDIHDAAKKLRKDVKKALGIKSKKKQEQKAAAADAGE